MKYLGLANNYGSLFDPCYQISSRPKRIQVSSKIAFSKNIECLYVGLSVLDYDSTLYNLVLVWETTITVGTSRTLTYETTSYGQKHAYVYI